MNQSGAKNMVYVMLLPSKGIYLHHQTIYSNYNLIMSAMSYYHIGSFCKCGHEQEMLRIAYKNGYNSGKLAKIKRALQ